MIVLGHRGLASKTQLWQGFICPITFVISLFNHNVNIYEAHNDGNWYNFGFVLGAGILFGGGSKAT